VVINGYRTPGTRSLHGSFFCRGKRAKVAKNVRIRGIRVDNDRNDPEFTCQRPGLFLTPLGIASVPPAAHAFDACTVPNVRAVCRAYVSAMCPRIHIADMSCRNS
jgi:hypothetical protein